jgi:hypothetical protein
VALSDDQRALLRLLAQREEGYGDIAALKGLSVDQVRAEVKEALSALETAGSEESTPPPASEPPAPAEEPRKAERAEPSPTPTPTPEPAEPQPPVKAAKPAPRRPRTPVPPERRRLLVLAGGALGIVAVVLIAIAVLGGDSDSDAGEAVGAGAEIAAEQSGKVTQAVLEPADGSDAAGRAIFGRVGKEEIVLQVTAEGLEPTEAGESYTVWLYRSPELTLRVGSVPVAEEGRLGARFSIPAELLAYVASGAFTQINVSRTSDAAYQREVARAKQSRSLPRYIGETVLTGEITGPVAKAGREAG